MAALGAGDFVQPTLRVPAAIQAGIDSGKLFRNGSVVRVVETGTIHKLLDEVSRPETLAEEAAKRAATINAKIMVPVVLATAVVAAVGAGAALVFRRRKNADELDLLAEGKVDRPDCVSKFEASLRAYVGAGRRGILNAEVDERLIEDLDAIGEWADGGNAVEFSFKQLQPLFSLVIEHTPALARAYSVALGDVTHQEPAGDAGVVVPLRQHLELQKRILGDAA